MFEFNFNTVICNNDLQQAYHKHTYFNIPQSSSKKKLNVNNLAHLHIIADSLPLLWAQGEQAVVSSNEIPFLCFEHKLCWRIEIYFFFLLELRLGSVWATCPPSGSLTSDLKVAWAILEENTWSLSHSQAVTYHQEMRINSQLSLSRIAHRTFTLKVTNDAPFSTLSHLIIVPGQWNYLLLVSKHWTHEYTTNNPKS